MRSGDPLLDHLFRRAGFGASAADLQAVAGKGYASVVDYLVDFQARQFDLKTPGGKARFVDAVMPTIRSVPNPVMRDAYLGRALDASA